MRPNGVTFDGKHSYNDFGLWLSTSPDLGAPIAKTNLVDVPGMDGLLDMTEANAGEVKFGNRTLTFTFSARVDVPEQEAFMGVIRNALHGRVIKQIVLDNDPEWFYTGRANVRFRNILSWKLQCIITVDAAPYAMRLEETVVDLMGGEVELNKIYLDTNDVAPDGHWNSDLRIGTVEFPGGLVAPADAKSDLVISWPEDAPHLSWWQVQVVDSDGGVYNSPRANYDPAANGGRWSPSTFAAVGVNLSKVYRVLVQGIGGCRLNWEMLSTHVVVVNSRKTVIPRFELETQADDVQITVNGTDYNILPGKSIREDIMLRSGVNEIYIPIVQAEPFTMTFREGKL